MQEGRKLPELRVGESITSHLQEVFPSVLCCQGLQERHWSFGEGVKERPASLGAGTKIADAAQDLFL